MQARFGEIEQRGAALTAKGRALFDRLFTLARESEVELEDEPAGASHVAVGTASETANRVHQAHLARFFAEFPDEWDALRRERLIFVSYFVVEGKDEGSGGVDLEELVREGKVGWKPILFEDFLYVQARCLPCPPLCFYRQADFFACALKTCVCRGNLQQQPRHKHQGACRRCEA